MTILQVLCCHLYKFVQTCCHLYEEGSRNLALNPLKAPPRFFGTWKYFFWDLEILFIFLFFSFLRPGNTFLGPENTFYLFFLLIFGTWTYVLMFSFFSGEKPSRNAHLLGHYICSWENIVLRSILREGCKNGVHRERPTP